ncbi:hypothetical protein PVAG01_00592 [Phlyctema vagabunda]|uniref:Uncharacterized protein n=1 Tax=Phlyctema vagabunda TaxID=108571 RepID=A0ABR4PUQ0_9HELO
MSSHKNGESSRGTSPSSSATGVPIPDYHKAMQAPEQPVSTPKLDNNQRYENNGTRIGDSFEWSSEARDLNLDLTSCTGVQQRPTSTSTAKGKGKEQADITKEPAQKKVQYATPAPAETPTSISTANEEAKRAKEQAESDAFAQKFNAAQAKGPLSVDDQEYRSLVGLFRRLQAEQAKLHKESNTVEVGGDSSKEKKTFWRIFLKGFWVDN